MKAITLSAATAVILSSNAVEARHARVLENILHPRRISARQSPFDDLMADIWSMPVYVDNQIRQTEQKLNRYRTNYELIEDEEGYKLALEVPGVTKEELDVTISEQRTLHIYGSRKYRDAANKVVNEAKFDHSFQLSAKCNVDEMNVSLKDGILTIVAPKKVPEVRRLSILSGNFADEAEQTLSETENRDG